MKKMMMPKIAFLLGALALASAGLTTTDAFARGGGGGFGGGGFGGGGWRWRPFWWRRIPAAVAILVAADSAAGAWPAAMRSDRLEPAVLVAMGISVALAAATSSMAFTADGRHGNGLFLGSVRLVTPRILLASGYYRPWGYAYSCY